MLGVDSDRAAVEETDRNARANYLAAGGAAPGPAERAGARRGRGEREPHGAPCEEVAAGWAARGERPGTLIASGFLREDADRIAGALAACGLEEARRVVSGDWAAILAKSWSTYCAHEPAG